MRGSVRFLCLLALDLYPFFFQEEEETPAHPKEEEDASMQHVESGWTLMSGRRRREWVGTHPAHRVPVGGKTTAHREWVDTPVRWSWVTEVVREDVQGL